MKFDAFGTSKHREGKSLLKIFFWLYLSVYWGTLIEQIKKSVIYTLMNPMKIVFRLKANLNLVKVVKHLHNIVNHVVFYFFSGTYG